MSGALSSTQRSGSVEVEFRKALRNGRSQPRAVKKAADKRSRGVRAGASDYRRQDGHATGPRLRPWPTQGHVRRYTGLDRNRRWREQLGFRHLSAKGKLRGEWDAAVLTKSVAHFARYQVKADAEARNSVWLAVDHGHARARLRACGVARRAIPINSRSRLAPFGICCCSCGGGHSATEPS